MENKKILELKIMPLVLTSIFWLLFYLLLFLIYFDKEPFLESLKYRDFYQKYALYTPLFFSILSLIIFYFLYFLKIIFRLKSVFFTTFIYFLIFWFFLFLWLDLLLFEPKYAEFLNLIILTFSYPLIISSLFILALVIIFSFKSKKN